MLKQKRCRRDSILCCTIAIAFGMGMFIALFGSLKIIVFLCALMLVILGCVVRR